MLFLLCELHLDTTPVLTSRPVMISYTDSILVLSEDDEAEGLLVSIANSLPIDVLYLVF